MVWWNDRLPIDRRAPDRTAIGPRRTLEESVRGVLVRILKGLIAAGRHLEPLTAKGPMSAVRPGAVAEEVRSGIAQPAVPTLLTGTLVLPALSVPIRAGRSKVVANRLSPTVDQGVRDRRKDRLQRAGGRALRSIGPRHEDSANRTLVLIVFPPTRPTFGPPGLNPQTAIGPPATRLFRQKRSSGSLRAGKAKLSPMRPWPRAQRLNACRVSDRRRRR